MLVWDNQQEMSWFVGFLEGEGSCCCSNNRYRISITNTRIDAINTCVSFLKKSRVFYTITEQIPKNKNWKKVYNIVISERNNCYTLIKILGSIFQCRYMEFMDKLKLSSSTTTRASSLSSDMYWLLGIVEAEGYFGLDRDNRGYYKSVISIKNTSIEIVRKLVNTLYSLSLSWTTQSEQGVNKRCYQIRIRGMFECKRFLDLFKNLWVTKHYLNRANLLLNFVSQRLANTNKREPYTQEQHQIYYDLKNMI